MSKENTAQLDVVSLVDAADEQSLEQQFDLLSADDEFLSEEESAALIQAHNDALDGGQKPTPDESDSAENADSAGAEDEPAEVDDADEITSETSLDESAQRQPEPYGGHASAREFIANGASLDDFVSQLSKPPVKSLQARVEDALDKPAAAAGADDRVSMGLGKAALLTGGAGLMKLAQLISGGGGMISSGIHSWQLGKADKQLRDAVSGLGIQLDGFRAQGLSELDNGKLSLHERQEMASQFFAKPENKQQLLSMFDEVNTMKQRARGLIEKSIAKGESADAVLERVLEPIKHFTDANEKFLESLKMGNETLLEKLDDTMNSLFELLKQMFARLAQSLGIGGKQSSEPRLG